MYSDQNTKNPPIITGPPFTALTSETEPQPIEPGLAPASLRGTMTISRDAREMTPVVFGTCFGWLHRNRERSGSDTAVVICAGLNRDALDAHYPLRVLADEIAAAGYLALRFSYPGTGDSEDVADTGAAEAAHWAAWQHSVDGAADWLRRTLGIRRLVFCGLRFGALLATLAAERHPDAVGLALLAPVLRGHSYMRQMAIEAQLQNDIVVAAGDPLHFDELSLDAGSIAAIGKVDLRQAMLPDGLAVGLFPQSGSTLVTACEQAWAKRGARVTSGSFDGMEPMLHHNIQGEGQASDFSALVDWLAQSVPARAIPLPRIAEANADLTGGDWIETPLRFGADRQLRGIFCGPREAVAKDAVLITNTGVDPHYGFGRFSVALARRLAGAGVASLRFDFAGLGDSLGRTGKENVVSGIFESDRRPDVSAAIDALAALGIERFAIGGVCSGAYHALQGALFDERLRALFLVNMPVFAWRAGDTIEFVSHKKSPAGYLAKLTDRKVLKQLLQGEIDVGGIIHSQRERLRERLHDAVRPVAKALGFATPSNPAYAAVATLSQRRVKTLFLYAPGDVGLDVFEQNFGRAGSEVPGYKDSVVKVVPDLNHNLSTREMRDLACKLLIDWMPARSG
jgi:pimeloyl-ACP methyl ester carboxylesterase